MQLFLYVDSSWYVPGRHLMQPLLFTYSPGLHAPVGWKDGWWDGVVEGSTDGSVVSFIEDTIDGDNDIDGSADGVFVGSIDGTLDVVGIAVGSLVGQSSSLSSTAPVTEEIEMGNKEVRVGKMYSRVLEMLELSVTLTVKVVLRLVTSM